MDTYATSYGSVKFSVFKRALELIEKEFPDTDPDVSFEYIVGSFFPEVVKNVHNEASKQYTLGYLAGLKDGAKEEREKWTNET